MGYAQKNRNAGITGILDLPGLGSGVKIYVKIYRWTSRLGGQTKQRRGRGGGVFRTVRWIMSSGTIAATGKIQFGTGWPLPDAWKGQTGTITAQVATGKTISYPVLVTEHSLSFDEKSEDTHTVAVAMDLTGAPTFTGWTGTQPAATDPTKADQAQWQGSVKTVDPKGLQTGATRLIDIYGTLTDTDAAEQTKLLAVISAAAPPLVTGGVIPHDLKLRSSSFERDALDGGTITEVWGLTNTEDDVEMPGTVYDVDSVHSDTAYIFGKVAIRVVQTDSTISWPTTPTQPADLKRGSVGKVQLNDSRWALTYNFVRNTTEDQIEVDGTTTRSDPDDLGETARITVVTNSSTPPSTPAAPVGLLVASETRPLTVANGSYTGYWVHTFDYGPTTRKQAIEFDGDYDVDANSTTRGISNSEVIPRVNSSSTPPATPTPTDTNLKLVRRVTRRIQGTTEAWRHTFIFGRNTSEDVAEHTRRTIDPNDLGYTEVIPLLHTSPTSSPGTPSQEGTASVLVETEVQRVCVANSSFTGLWLWTFKFGTTTRLQEQEFQGVATLDPATIGGLENSETVFDVTSSSTPPSVPTPGNDLKHLSTRSRRIAGTPERWLHIFEFGRNNSEDRLEISNTVTVIDPNDIDEGGTVGVVHTSATPPSTPSAPGGVLVKTRVRPLAVANGSFTGLWLHVFEFGPLTDLNKLEYAGVFKNDPRDLRDVETVVDITTSSTTPSTPTPSDADLKLVGVDRKRIQNTPEQWQHVFYFGRNDAEDEIETRGTFTITNTDDLLEEASITLVTSSATPPSDPGTPNSAVLDDIKTDPITVANGSYAGRWAHTFIYRPNTKKQSIERGGTVATMDNTGAERDATATIEVFATSLDSMRDTVRTDNLNDPTFRDVSLRRLDATNVLQRIERISNDIIIADNIQVEYQNRASFAGQVQVSQIRHHNAGYYEGFVSPIGLYVKTGTVVLRRRYIGATALTFSATQTAYFFRLLLGTTNVAEFLGYEIASLMYRGWRNVRNYTYEATPTAHVVEVEHVFEYASPVGWYNDSQIAFGWRPSATALTIGLNAPSKFFWTITPNGTGNFSLFLA